MRKINGALPGLELQMLQRLARLGTRTVGGDRALPAATWPAARPGASPPFEAALPGCGVLRLPLLAGTVLNSSPRRIFRQVKTAAIPASTSSAINWDVESR